jgi:DNA-directed RNA polymerase subunit N (RpoN/RPB10)
MVRCLSCGRALAEAYLDVYCPRCLDAVYSALAELLAWSTVVWRYSDYW